jgi:tetratricopeptide (TPR) repeat protein
LNQVRARDINIVRGDIIHLAPEPAPRALPPEPRAGIPPDPIEHFTGREPDLAELHQQLQQRRRVVLHGLGGVGKTQLALRYLDLHRTDYPAGCFWLRADQASTLIGDLASLAWRIKPPLPEREEVGQERQLEAVLRWLREHDRWLLVLDNLDQPVEEAMRHWLPPGLPGHLIVTSRSPQGTTRLDLQPLPLEVATSFLLERTGQDDVAAAHLIVEALGGLPLALEQAAAYLIENDWRSLADYADQLRTRMADLLREGKPDDYPLPVASTLDLSFQRVEEKQPAAADLLRLCAFLAPDDIPMSALQAAAGELPEPLRGVLEDEIESDRALGVLRGYSLVRRQQDELRVHRLVQWVVRGSLQAEAWEQWVAAAVRLLVAVFPRQVEDPKQWPLCARLLPHAQAVIGLMGDRFVEPEVTKWLLDRTATYLQKRRDYALARPLFERALAISEWVLGPDHPDTAGILNNLASLLQDQGDLAAARPLLERTLTISEQELGPEHPNTAVSLNNLASLLQDQGDLAAARPLSERALAIRERVLGPDHPDTALSLNNLALLLRAQGDLAAARPLFERALAIRERVLGPDHPDTANSLGSLAGLLQDQGELDTALPLFERALAIRERVLGPDDPDTANSLGSLAYLRYLRGELDAALPLFERAPTIYEQAFGPDHPNTAQSLYNLAYLRHAQGELEAARPLFERAVAIWERALGRDHPVTAAAHRRLAELGVEADRPADAE